MICSTGFRSMCMCLLAHSSLLLGEWTSALHCWCKKKARRQPSVLFQNLYVLKLVTLHCAPSLQIIQICGWQKEANIWSFAEVSRAWVLIVLYVWYLKSPSSDLALHREQKKSEQSEQTAQSEKRPNAIISLSLVWVISSQSLLSRWSVKVLWRASLKTECKPSTLKPNLSGMDDF